MRCAVAKTGSGTDRRKARSSFEMPFASSAILSALDFSLCGAPCSAPTSATSPNAALEFAVLIAAAVDLNAIGCTFEPPSLVESRSEVFER